MEQRTPAHQASTLLLVSHEVGDPRRGAKAASRVGAQAPGVLGAAANF